MKQTGNSYQSFLSLCEPIIPIIRAIKKVKGTPYAVGGCVRDLLLGRQIKDVDIEVHGLTMDQLEGVLEQFGNVQLIGKKFGVLLLSGIDVDWALPRRDSKGRKPTVEIDSTMTVEQAARRRDLTMNAMSIDLNVVCENFDALKNMQAPTTIDEMVQLFKVVDPYNGVKHLQQQQLCFVDEQLFLEDPLRFFRVMQFIGRFEMMPDEHLNELCRTMSLSDSQTGRMVAQERINEEIKKLFLKSYRPSLGFRWLREIGRLKEIFPELHLLIGVRQRPDYHPEGDVFEHTMQALDASARLDDYRDDKEKFLLMTAVLCHDLGKITNTDHELRCHGHDKAGVPFAKKLIKRFSGDQALSKAVCKLVAQHMQPIGLLRNNASIKAYKRLALKLTPDVTMRQLALVALCDWRGRNGNGHEPLSDHNQEFVTFLENAEAGKVLHQPEPPVLLGRHLMDVMQPGPKMGKLLQEAYRIQIEEDIQDLEELKRRVL